MRGNQMAMRQKIVSGPLYTMVLYSPWATRFNDRNVRYTLCQAAYVNYEREGMYKEPLLWSLDGGESDVLK